MTDIRFQSIPPAEGYPGMVKFHVGGDRCVQAVGWGAEAERRVRERAQDVMGEPEEE